MSKRKEPDDPVQLTEALSSSVLREMVNSLEETKLKLLLNIKELKEKLAQQKEDQTDIYYFLNKKCDESFEVIASLEEQILNEQADREIAEKLFENKLEDLRNAALSNDAKYNTKISELESRLEMLNSFSEIKEETEQNLKNLMSKLEEERIQFSVNAESMENKFLLEREKLRKSYDVKYENIKSELELSIDGKLTKKTKKTQIMNIIMKKELDSQSKHAEKLLEINATILEKDRDLKMELELSTSLQTEMTSKLAMYQRVIKQMNEKVAAQEAVADQLRVVNEEKFHSKEEELIRLEARLHQLSKKASRDNSKLDDMWRFISQSYQLIKARGSGGHSVGHHTGSVGSVTSSIESTSPHMDHELLLVELVREVAHRHPKALASLLSVHHPNQQGVMLGGGMEQQSTSVVSSGPRHFEGVSSRAGVGAGSTVSAHSSFATGIPTWDAKSDSIAQSKSDQQKSMRTVGVQTDAKLAPYPLGSTWLDPTGAKSGMFVMAGMAAQGIGGATVRPTSLPTDDRSLDMHSMPSLWGAVGGGSVSLMSVASEDTYSIKTASYAIPQPAGASSRMTSKHKALAKIRKGQLALGGGSAPPSQFRDLDQILSEAASRPTRTHAVKLVMPRHALSDSLSPHDKGGKESMTQPHSPPSTHMRRSEQLLLQNNSGGGRVSRSTEFASRPQRLSSEGPPASGALMAISGQGFVSPFALPKLI